MTNRISDMTLAAPPTGDAYMPFVVPDTTGGLSPTVNYYSNVGGTRINVKDFGATGDGTTVDTVAINLAIAACTAGQTLYFPAGTYIVDNSDLQTTSHGVTSTVPLSDGVNVHMDGGALVKAADTSGGIIFFTCDGNNILQVNTDGNEFPGSMTGAWPAVGSAAIICGINADNVTVINSNFKNSQFGINVRGGSKWKIVNCNFYRFSRSGILFQTVASATSHNVVANCTFEDMGDTAAAFAPAANNGFAIAYNVIIGCTVKNTNYQTQGFAFDVEGGFAFGLYHHNAIVGNTVEQTVLSSTGQGGITMNLYSEDSLIADNVLKSETAFAGDIGISIAGSRRVAVHGNKIIGFRKNAVAADGAAGASVRSNVIHNCGDGSNASWSAVLFSEELGSTDCTFADNDLSWDTAYTYGGTTASALLAKRFNAFTVTNLTVRGNTFRNPLGYGINVFGFTGGFSLARVTIEDNVIIGDGSATVFGSEPIVASWIDGLSLQNNRVYETKKGINVTGSTKAQVKNNTIENITTSPTLAVWLNLTSSDNAWVEGNRFSTSAPTAKFTTTSATNLHVRGNDGYKTENWGTSAAIATGATIAHGLDVTPTQVSLLANVATAVKAGATVDATNITVTHDSGGSTAFLWHARGAA